MSTETIERPAESTALTLPQRAAVALGAADYEVKIKAKVAASTDIMAVIDPDGREQAHRIGMDLLKLRTGVTGAGEAARKDATAFSRAVIAKEKELVALITPEETRVFGLRDSFDEKVATEKAAKIAVELERVATIQKAVQALRDMPLLAVGKSASEISALIGGLAGTMPDDSFQEYLDDAKQARLEALDKLAAAEAQQRGVEVEAESRRQEAARIAAEAEAARIAEAERLAAERLENARVAAENARVAAEQAAEAMRLADLAAAQQAAALALQREAEAKAQAARDEHAKAAAAQQLAFDMQKAEMDAQRRALEQRQAEADARDAAAKAQMEREAAHPEALMMNAEFDVARDAALAQEAERVRLHAMTVQAVEDDHDPMPSLEALMEDVGPEAASFSDDEIIRVVMLQMAMSRDQVIDRLQAINFDAARAGRS